VRIVGRSILEAFAAKHAEIRPALDAWTCEVEEAQWDTPDQIKARFAAASFLRDNRVLFNLKGNKYRLDTKIAYQTHIVFIVRIGTHAEYERWDF
jgi:mRNA interferase HigB